MEKITYFDLIRISKKETAEPCAVKKGAVIQIITKNPSKIVTGLVTKVYPDKMCVMTNNTKQWWTRFVNCQIISYT
jgi:hypothetical protein